MGVQLAPTVSDCTRQPLAAGQCSSPNPPGAGTERTCPACHVLRISRLSSTLTVSHSAACPLELAALRCWSYSWPTRARSHWVITRSWLPLLSRSQTVSEASCRTTRIAQGGAPLISLSLVLSRTRTRIYALSTPRPVPQYRPHRDTRARPPSCGTPRIPLVHGVRGGRDPSLTVDVELD